MLDLVPETKAKIQLLLGQMGSKVEEADMRGVGAAITEGVAEEREVNLAVLSGRCERRSRKLAIRRASVLVYIVLFVVTNKIHKVASRLGNDHSLISVSLLTLPCVALRFDA